MPFPQSLQDEGGYHVYATDLPGLDAQGSDLKDAMAGPTWGRGYVEGL